MSRKRKWNKVSTSTLEETIIDYLYQENFDAADAIQSLAKTIEAPIDLERIEKERGIVGRGEHVVYEDEEGEEDDDDEDGGNSIHQLILSGARALVGDWYGR